MNFKVLTMRVVPILLIALVVVRHCAAEEREEPMAQLMLQTLQARAKAHHWKTLIAAGNEVSLLGFDSPEPRSVYRAPKDNTYYDIRNGALSPDASQIAFTQRPSSSKDPWKLGLFLLDLTSGSLHRLVEADEFGGLCWSPDGKKLVYVSREGKEDQDPPGYALRILDLHTRQSDVLVQGDEYDVTNQAWSPDGHQVLYMLFASQDQKQNTLMIYDFPSRTVRKFVKGGALATWSPKSDRITYRTIEEDGAVLHLIRPDGQDDVILLRDKLDLNNNIVTPPLWSPDGEYLLYGRTFPPDPVGQVPYVFELSTKREAAVPAEASYAGLWGFHSWSGKSP